ncbi:unnamed protein product [Amoebophrya sp. A120]|nr:unnamed protein product [Amoebophrya sp. A120]|eukprot:GSA120T00002204001.1
MTLTPSSPETVVKKADWASRLASPTGIATSLGLLLCVTTTQYFFDPPQLNTEAAQARFIAIQGDQQEEKKFLNYWGTPDAEFDWCEANYVSTLSVPRLWSSSDETTSDSAWIEVPVAESWNTVTSVLYLFPVVVPFWNYFRLLQMKSASGDANSSSSYSYSPAAVRALVFLFCIMIGTTLFHMTLRYWAQLVDELPIYYIMLNGNFAVWNCRRKLSRSGNKAKLPSKNPDRVSWALARFTVCWGLGLSMGILTTLSPERKQLHQVLRGLMSTSFSILFVHEFYAFARVFQALDQATGEKMAARKFRKSFVDARSMFHLAFLELLLAILCWVVDNGFCSALRTRLPFYPQTHAWWHFWTVVGLYHMFLVTEIVEQLAVAVPEVEARVGGERDEVCTQADSSEGEKKGAGRTGPFPELPHVGTVCGGWVHILVFDEPCEDSENSPAEKKQN